MSDLVRPRIIRCPGCGGPSVYSTANPHRPFCSERCRGADFGAWASESYRVAKEPADDDDENSEASNEDREPPH